MIHNNGGFVFVEFAIALPLLILLICGLMETALQVFKLGKNQLADYVLESEAQYVMERITHAVRAAKEIEADNDDNSIKIVYHTIFDDNTTELIEVDIDPNDWLDNYWSFKDKDVLETQIFIPRKEDGIYKTLNAKRQESGSLSNPITGGNFFGDTKINYLKFSKLNENVLHITLEMESLTVEKSKIKIATAVFMPGCEKLDIIP